jgi:SAM-dependent methyltransferase
MLTSLIKKYKEPIKKVYKRYRTPFLRVYVPLHRIGNKRQCYVCKRTFGRFTKFKGGSAFLPEWIVKLEMIGSDVDNFGCPYCNSFDRERHLVMYFDKLDLWNKVRGNSVLHFAPEYHLSKKISEQQPAQYVMGDLFPAKDGIRKIDATSIDYPDATFDAVIANHILEHIPDYLKAMSEFFRVLKPGGFAILQTPFSKVLMKNFEDEGISTSDMRLFFYAQRDHVRVFGERSLRQSLEQTGFLLQIAKHSEYFSDDEAFRYGVNCKEDLIMVKKPKQV